MAAQLASLSRLAKTIKSKLVPYATLTARMATLDSDPSAGRTAPLIRASVMMAITATSLMLMAEVLARCMKALDARNGVPYGIQSATIISIMSAAASAHQTAPRV